LTELLDGNVLVGLAKDDHSTFAAAHRWWRTRGDVPFATCPITQGSLLRLLLFSGADVEAATTLLRRICDLPQHEFWSDDVGYLEVDLTGVLGHRQVTDAYLAALARHHGGRLVTFDHALAVLHADVATLISA